ncbi:MAG TPA: hypothetical protein VFQ60_00240 [Patescibacteria group bacterium]|nr:hypothetical protein [Patescibacteria group bacterium]
MEIVRILLEVPQIILAPMRAAFSGDSQSLFLLGIFAAGTVAFVKEAVRFTRLQQ